MIENGRDNLCVTCFDPQTTGAVHKAILSANVGLNPQRVGDTLLIKVPALDDEQRARLDKRVRSLAEEQHIAIRNIRKGARNQAKRSKTLDKIKRPLDELVKEKTKVVDQMMESKLNAIHWKDPEWNIC